MIIYYKMVNYRLSARADSQCVLSWANIVTPLGYRSVTKLPKQSILYDVTNRAGPMV